MLTMKDIIREGHPTLTKRSETVPIPLDAVTMQTLKAMRQFLIDSQTPELAEKYALRPGVGLAAPQIDVPLRMLAIYTEDELFETHHDYLMVNPRLLSHSESLTYMPGGEGCLSIDREVAGLVPRYRQVTIRTRLFDPSTEQLSEEVTLKLKGFLSIVFQHELDHLNGILFPSRVKPTLEGVEPVRFKLIESEDEES